jgi:hypothetical protein
MDPEAVWAYYFAVCIITYNAPTSKNNILDMINYLEISFLDRQKALNHLRDLNVIDDNVISHLDAIIDDDDISFVLRKIRTHHARDATISTP